MLLSSNSAVSPATQKIVINVGEICANCVEAVRTQLLQQPGVISTTVDVAVGIATVEGTAEVDSAELVECLTIAGFPSQIQHSEAEPTSSPQTSRHWTLMGFFILVIGFNLCLNAQVLTVGLAYFYNLEWWKAHVWLVRSYSGLSLILLVWAYRIPVPRRVRSLAASMPVLLGLQFLTIHLKTSIPLAIVHPLIGFTLFSASTILVHRVSRFLFPKEDEDVFSIGEQKPGF